MYHLNINRNLVFLLIFNIILLTNASDFKNDVTTSATPTTLQRSTVAASNSESESLTKRDIKITDLSSANTISGKSYDPPPEFYRGPGSTGHYYTSTVAPSYYNYNYKPSSGFLSKPIAFPDNNNHNNYGGGVGVGGSAGADGSVIGGIGAAVKDKADAYLAHKYNSWQNLKGTVDTLLNKKGTIQDRISVGHYGTPDHGSGGGGGGAASGISGGYSYDSRPYGGAPHHVEYIPSNQHYGGGVASSTAHTGGGYYGGSGVASAEGIPFDVYGNKNHYSSSGGGDYTYSYPDMQEPAAHKTHPELSQKALLAKSFLIPLASAAVLGLAAALVSNPLLLQLGTVSGIAPGAAVLGKRKRRDLTSTSTTLNGNSSNVDTNDLYLASKKKDSSLLLPYRAHHHHHRHLVRT